MNKVISPILLCLAFLPALFAQEAKKDSDKKGLPLDEVYPRRRKAPFFPWQGNGPAGLPGLRGR